MKISIDTVHTIMDILECRLIQPTQQATFQDDDQQQIKNDIIQEYPVSRNVSISRP